MKFIVNKATLQTQNLIDNLSKKKFKKTPLIKTKIIGNKNVSGKNNTGKITIYHKGIRSLSFSGSKTALLPSYISSS